MNTGLVFSSLNFFTFNTGVRLHCNKQFNTRPGSNLVSLLCWASKKAHHWTRQRPGTGRFLKWNERKWPPFKSLSHMLREIIKEEKVGLVTRPGRSPDPTRFRWAWPLEWRGPDRPEPGASRSIRLRPSSRSRPWSRWRWERRSRRGHGGPKDKSSRAQRDI